MKIKQNKFGNSDKYISEISFGCGGFWGLPIFPIRDAEKLIETAIEKGINFFDTGPNYSRGNAEKRMGNLLKHHKYNVFFATKIGSYLSSSGRRVRDFSSERINQSIHNSLKKLQTDRLFLVQFHGPSSDVLNDGYARDTLLKLKDEGKIKHIGVSGDGSIIEEAINISYIDCIMTTFNIITQSSFRNILNAKKHNKAVLIKSPLSHMTFSNNIFKINSISKLWYILRILKNYKTTLFRAQKYQFINSVKNWENTEIALKFILENPNITSTVIGTTKLIHLEKNIQTCFRENLPGNVVDRLIE